jgi:hypothetical protein
MKKALLALLLVSGSAMAQHHDYYRHYHHGYWQRGAPGWVWVAPTIIGGVIGYEIARNQPPVVVPQPPVIVQTPQVCSPWAEVQNPDGTITRTRTCSQ